MMKALAVAAGLTAGVAIGVVGTLTAMVVLALKDSREPEVVKPILDDDAVRALFPPIRVVPDIPYRRVWPVR